MITNQFNPHEIQKAAEILKAIAHPLRLAILQILADGNSYSVSELYQMLGCSQSLMSQQLKILHQAKLVDLCKEKTIKRFRLANRDFIHLFECLHRHLHTFF